MIAPVPCKHPRTKKHGRDANGQQRYRCSECGKTWIDKESRPLGHMRLDKARAVMVLKMMVEGVSIRAIERVTGVNRNTVLALIDLIGWRCRLFWETRMVDLPVGHVECDEVWGFVGMKERTRERKDASSDYGDAYCFLALDRDSKLVVAWHCGKRDVEDTNYFTAKIARATSGRFQITTDGFTPYCWAVPSALGNRADFAQLVKIYSNQQGAGRYSPGEIMGTRKRWMFGHPDMDQVGTSRVERFNLSVRMSLRRMTRLTNGHSKKWAYHEAAIAIWLTFYNFCRPHESLNKQTPAMAHGIADEKWSLERMLDELAEVASE